MPKANRKKLSSISLSLPTELVELVDEWRQANFESRTGVFRRLIVSEAKRLGYNIGTDKISRNQKQEKTE